VKNKETGEFELVVGNAQIIAGFFILALLLAVFFAMGFIVARAKYQQEPVTAASPQPELRPQPPAQAAQHPAEQPAADATKSDATGQSAASGPPETAPAEAAKTAAAEAKTEAKTESKPETKAETKAEAPPAAPAEAAPGTYWQVTATNNLAAARAMLQSMKDMGLPASLSPGPNNLTRVLVGPYTDNATLAKVKTQLENAGLQPLKRTQ
jgi:cell division septation protein DedD